MNTFSIIHDTLCFTARAKFASETAPEAGSRTYEVVYDRVNPLPTPGISHGRRLGRRSRPAAAHAAPEVPW